MKITLDIAGALAAIMWPIVIFIILLVFRKNLLDLIKGIAGKVKKLEFSGVSLEFAEGKTITPWSAIGIPQSAEMISGDIYSTSLTTLFDIVTPQITEPIADKQDAWDYLLVDIREGQFWFISRVFIFTIFLQMLRGVKCVVFVETKGDYRRRLLGMASPDLVRKALADAYPWFEGALRNAFVEKKTYLLDLSLLPITAGEIIRSFIIDPLMRTKVAPKPNKNSTEWTRLGTQSIWEHTGWLTDEKVSKDIGQYFYEWDSSRYDDLPGTSPEKRSAEILQRKAPFIALVNSKGEFKSLLERRKLLEQVAESVLKE